jgi:hypothetical protein
MVREWIIFALCLGLGGHIALAVVLHAPERWLWSHAGLYGLVLGVGVYGSVQLIRALRWAVRSRKAGPAGNGGWSSGSDEPMGKRTG